MNAPRQYGRGSPGYASNEQCGCVAAAEFQLAAEFFGVDFDAAFFDFSWPMPLARRCWRVCDAEWEHVFDFETGKRRVGDSLRAREIGRAVAQRGEFVFGGEYAF